MICCVLLRMLEAVEGALCLLEVLEVPEVICCVLLRLLEVSEVSEVLEAMRCVLLCMLEGLEGRLCSLEVLEMMRRALWRRWRVSSVCRRYWR